MAVPVVGPGGALVCAIGCSAPSFLAGDIFNDAVLSRLVDAADRLSAALGGTPGPRPHVDFTPHTPAVAGSL